VREAREWGEGKRGLKREGEREEKGDEGKGRKRRESRRETGEEGWRGGEEERKG